ncbi:MAG: AAA family ATPase [Candidatus Handelsmanbacteria bacterium]|nr:AAA family ATPase [Candidatus Handelsmanbacteria bacterium]
MDIRAEKMGLDPDTLRQFLARQYQAAAQPPPEVQTAGPAGTDPPGTLREGLEFDLKPEELITYLDQYVIGQSEAKAILATKFCTHFNRLRLPADDEEELVGNIKNNVLMIGPTGVGKTFLIKLIARRLGVPFVKADATKFSETGYVGGDVEDLVRELVREAAGDIGRAQYGIIYIDEIDKIATSRNTYGPDVSRSGVQRNLLKLMEETEVDIRSPHDIASQMESVLQMQRTGKAERRKVNTRHILFVVSGAFSGLEEIIARRLNRGQIGFRASAQPPPEPAEGARLVSKARAEDLVAYGFESEFIGRLPIIAVLDELGWTELLEILRNPKSSVILAKKRDFLAYGITLEFTDEALQLLSQRAGEERTGARALVGVIEKVLLHFERRLPSVDIPSLKVTREVVEDPTGSLRELLFHHSLSRFCAGFLAAHGIRLEFPPAALAALRQLTLARDLPPEELCRQLLADYGHGLRLIEQREFAVGPQVLHHPQETLNELIKEFYNRRR